MEEGTMVARARGRRSNPPSRRYANNKIWIESLERLRLLSDVTGISIARLVDDLTRAEVRRLADQIEIYERERTCR